MQLAQGSQREREHCAQAGRESEFCHTNFSERGVVLADLVRPQMLNEVVGQQHLIAKDSMLKKLLDVGHIPNMIFYGSSGTGKTTIANIIAKIEQGFQDYWTKVKS